MESGINPADQNYYSRQQQTHSHPPPPPPPTSSQDRIQHTERTYSPSPHFETALKSPQLPPKLPFLTTQNLHAATVNGFIGSGGGDPDEFYRDYRGVQQSANSYTDVATNNMAHTSSESRMGPSSLRSNGNGSTAKHPQLPSHNPPPVASRLRTSYRSASSPLDDRVGMGNPKSVSALNGYPASRQQPPSVKDLLKRFDQNNDQPPARKPSARIVTTNGVGNMRGPTGYQARSSTSNTVSRAGSSTRDSTGPGRVRIPPTTTAKTTQRARFAAEDQHSNNTLSSAARATRPRNIVPGNNLASKSMTNLSPTSPNHPPQPPQPSSLFGEVTAAKQSTEIGHGIPRSVGRRTSDSHLHTSELNHNPPSWLQDRARLDDDFEAPSPTTAWYRGAATLDDAAKKVTPRSSLGHNRNHSDMPDNKVNTMNGVNPTFSTTVATPISPREAPRLPDSGSRIPVKSNRFSGSSESSSVASTRINSRAASPSGRGSTLRLHNHDKRPWSPAAGSATPTNRSKTPTRSRGSVRPTNMTSNSNASLKAYISAPLPKLSPPLRSSHFRQPVSSASTASSRQKAVDRSGSPQQARTGMKVTRTPAADRAKPKSPPERILDQGPVDFEAHRAKIKRAYTKSIHETEQAEIRMANMKRLHERQVRNSIAAAAKKTEEEAAELPKVATPPPPSPEPLHINTSFSPVNSTPIAPVTQDQDSPTLPGAFIEDEVPQSAISNATEIENEEQIEAPHLSHMLSSQSLAPIMTSNQVFFPDDQFSPEQAMHGMSHNDDEIQIMLAPTPVDIVQPEITPTNAEFPREIQPSPPESFLGDADLAEYQQEFTMQDLTAEQSDVSPIQPSPVRNVESRDEPSTPIEFPVHFDITVMEEPPIVPDIMYPAELISPTDVDHTEGTRFGLHSLRTALAPSVMMDEIGDNLMTPVTDFEYDGSSDGIEGMHRNEQNANSYYQPRESHAPDVNRQSHRLSSWTDFTISDGGFSGQEDYLSFPTDPLVSESADAGLERKPTPPPKEHTLSVSPIVPPKPDGYNPAPSPRFQLSHSSLAGPAHGQSLPLSTSEVRPPSIVSVTPLWPEYASPQPSVMQPGDISPAPTRSPPPPNFYMKRPPSSLYQNSFNEGRRSEDAFQTRPIFSSTHGSSIHGSMEDSLLSNGYDLGSMPAESIDSTDAVPETDATIAEKKRLFKRRNLIQELIDTEAVFIKDMNVVEEIYKGTAEACPRLDKNDISTIFRNTCKIIAFSTKFFEELKSAGASVYQNRRKTLVVHAAPLSDELYEERLSTAQTLVEETDEQKDLKTFIGANFGKHLKEMETIYTEYLKTSENAQVRLITLKTDSAVKVWLGECNLVSKDLTHAWDLDALLVKPVQRITRYQLFLKELCHVTPDTHPDHSALQCTCNELGILLNNIDDMKRRIAVVDNIVKGRKRKDSDVRTGIAKAFGRRTEKLVPTSSNRPAEDEEYIAMKNKFNDDYLRLQVVMRDVEFYTRQCTTYVQDFLRYLSSMELIMRMSASPYPELESKWARFNMSMRDMGTVALEDHILSVRSKVIDPFDQVIKAYGPPGNAMRKRNKRRLDYEKSLNTKVKDAKLTELVGQYEALNDTLKLELPRLSTLTETIGNIALVQFVSIQVQWYHIWQEKVKIVLEESQIPKDIEGIVEMFSRDYKYVEGRAQELGIVNGNFDGVVRAPRLSTQEDEKSRHRPSNLSTRPKSISTSDKSPCLPTPDFVKADSQQFTFSPMVATAPPFPAPYANPAYPLPPTRASPASPATTDPYPSRYYPTSNRPSTSRSHTSDTVGPRPSTDYTTISRRESGYSASRHVDGPPTSTRPYSGLFTSALPDGPESRMSSRGSSRDHGSGEMRANVLYLAASLFEFNISATKSEAGYPYLTYQAGEIFDVIGEKGELWLAKNQDDATNVVGWIWSKHFARLATD